MKFTIIRRNKQNKLFVSKKTVERFLERIAKDDAKQSVANFDRDSSIHLDTVRGEGFRMWIDD